jgi:hypothetical protein
MARRRPLTSVERKNALDIFRDSIDYDAVLISRGSPFALVTATTIGNKINLGAGHFVGNTMELSPRGYLVLIHELAHVWQFQNGGFTYIRSSVFVQFVGLITRGSRRAAYDWRKAHNTKLPWDKWNAEQQAECVSHYHVAVRCADRDTMRNIFPYIRRVRRREGAPGSLRRRPFIRSISPRFSRDPSSKRLDFHTKGSVAVRAGEPQCRTATWS